MHALNANYYSSVCGGLTYDFLPQTHCDEVGLIAGAVWGGLTLGLAIAANGAYHHRYHIGHYARFTLTSMAYMGMLAAGTTYLCESIIN